MLEEFFSKATQSMGDMLVGAADRIASLTAGAAMAGGANLVGALSPTSRTPTAQSFAEGSTQIQPPIETVINNLPEGVQQLVQAERDSPLTFASRDMGDPSMNLSPSAGSAVATPQTSKEPQAALSNVG